MNSAWSKGFKKGSQELVDLEAAFNEAAFLRRKLAEILERKYLEEAEKRISSSGYDTANWAYYQADAIGYARAMKEIMAMLKDTSKK